MLNKSGTREQVVNGEAVVEYKGLRGVFVKNSKKESDSRVALKL